MLWAISRAPLAKLQAFRQRMGWTFPWGSSFDSDFAFDYDAEAGRDGQVSFTPAISVFYKDEKGEVFHTYSCHSKRGIEMVNGADPFPRPCAERSR